MTKTCTVTVPKDRVVTDADQLRWGVVSTIRAPLRDIVRFVAYHLDLGAAQIHIFLDVPDRETAAVLARQPTVTVTQCDEGYWSKKPPTAQVSHQLRQAHNATRCYRRSNLDWLAHIDVDEFLLSPRPIAEVLANCPPEAAYARMRPAEMLAQTNPWNGPAHFKLTYREVGRKRRVLDQIYPDIGMYLPGGFLSHTGGKIFARTGLPDIRLGIHSLLQNKVKVGNGHVISGTHVGHAHAPTWEAFQRHFDFRMTKGSYRRKNTGKIELRDIFQLALEDDGIGGLRRLYDQICAATPDLLQRLDKYHMLLSARLDLDHKVANWFGEIPDN